MTEIQPYILTYIPHNSRYSPEAAGEFASLISKDVFTAKMLLNTPGLGCPYQETEGRNPGELVEKFKTMGIPSQVVSSEDLASVNAPTRVSSAKIMEDRIIFRSRDREWTYVKGTPLLATIGNLAELDGVADHAPGGAGKSDDRRLDALFFSLTKGAPVMDVYWDNESVRIYRDWFSYSDMGSLSSIINFKTILKKLLALSENQAFWIPFRRKWVPAEAKLTSDDRVADQRNPKFKEQNIRAFSAFSLHAVLAWKKKLFDQVGEIGAPVSAAPTPKKHAAPPPSGSLSAEPSGLGGIVRLGRFGRWLDLLKEARQLGPPWLTTPLIIMTLIGLLAFFAFGDFSRRDIMRNRPSEYLPSLMLMGIWSASALSLVYGLTSLRRKRRMEDMPTSKVRSAPIGRVELKGAGRQKYSLNTPYTKLPCLHFSFVVEEWRRDSRNMRGGRWVRTGGGNSGNLPFYLEDDTGRILIYPEGARIEASTKATTHRGARSVRYREKYIPAFSGIYVLGVHQTRLEDPSMRRKAIIDKIRQIKKSEDFLDRYDRDGDGIIDESEMALAREDAEEQYLEEMLAAGETDEDEKTFIGKGRPDDDFVIADRSEESLQTKTAFTAVLGIVLGLAGVGFGVYFLLNISYFSWH